MREVPRDASETVSQPPAAPHCEVCGGPMQYVQRVGRLRPVDYYQCEDCGRVWHVDQELSAHWRRAAF